MLFGEDLVRRGDKWVSQKSKSHDQAIRRATDHDADRAIRSAYRVLMTREAGWCGNLLRRRQNTAILRRARREKRRDCPPVSIVLPIAPSSTAEEFGRWPSWRAAERMDAEQFRAALTDLLGAQPPLNPLIRDSSASALTTWHADGGRAAREPIVWRSIDVVTADDHKVQRVGQEGRHARQRFVVITGTAEGEVLTAWNVKEAT